jgi:hypothetical protein
LAARANSTPPIAKTASMAADDHTVYRRVCASEGVVVVEARQPVFEPDAPQKTVALLPIVSPPAMDGTKFAKVGWRPILASDQRPRPMSYENAVTKPLPCRGSTSTQSEPTRRNDAPLSVSVSGPI